ncbi:MAG: hypothetical protein HXX17_16500 [Geobacteraceae bacterium]|nr:hypothetical protein [Geobacteraceae bacterium]
MKTCPLISVAAALLSGAAILSANLSFAGSCCGGGSATTLNVPKYAKAVADLSFEMEKYDGFWNQDGVHIKDPPGSDLNQYRMIAGVGYRLAQNWQASISVPYVWNDNKYSGVSSNTRDLGDTTVSLLYELHDDPSAWKVREAADLIPGVTIGASLLLPTGVSPYDSVTSSFDVTGRGFYRLDGNLLLEKTLQPFNASIALSYGTYFERSVNREYGKYVEPYRKSLGDRASASGSLGYTYVMGSGGDSIGASINYAFLHEDDSKYSGKTYDNSGFAKQSFGAALTYANVDSDWSLRAGWNHGIQSKGWGRNFPTTDIFSMGVRYVFH